MPASTPGRSGRWTRSRCSVAGVAVRRREHAPPVARRLGDPAREKARRRPPRAPPRAARSAGAARRARRRAPRGCRGRCRPRSAGWRRRSASCRAASRPAAWSGSWPSIRVGAGLVEEHVRERVRQVARDRDEPVVRAGVDRDRAARRATVTNPCTRAEQLRAGRRGRRQEPGRALEQLGGGALGAARLGAADRVPADEAGVAAGGGADRALRRADVGDRALVRRDARAPRARRAGSSRDRRRDERRGRRRRRASASVAAGSTASRSAATREHVRVGIPAAHASDARAPRGERGGRADQARPDDGDVAAARRR